MTVLAPLLEPAFAVRVIATAVIVIGVTLAVERLGPRIGGALAGLPIVIGPGFFFLLAERGPAFSAEAAAYTLTSLSATQAFLLTYCAAAGLPAGVPLAAACAAWFGSAFLFSYLPPSPVLGLMLFGASLVGARRIGARFLGAAPPRRPPGGLTLLIVRGLAAGLLVAVVTVAANRLGTGWSGILIAFPIGFTVISVTVHRRSGRDTAVATLHAAMLGVASLAAFAFVLSGAASLLSPAAAFLGALAAGIAVTSVLTGMAARFDRYGVGS